MVLPKVYLIWLSWFITPITMVYGTYNKLVTGANLNQLITGGPHIVVFMHVCSSIHVDKTYAAGGK